MEHVFELLTFTENGRVFKIDLVCESEFAQIPLDIVNQIGLERGSEYRHIGAQNRRYLDWRRRFKLENNTDLHELTDFLIDEIIADANDGIQCVLFLPLFLRLFLADEFDERSDAALVAVVHAINFVHYNGDSLLLSLHHFENILGGNIVGGYALDERLVAHVAGVVMYNVMVDFTEEAFYEMGLAAAGRTVDVNAFFEMDIVDIGLECVEYLFDSIGNIFSVECLVGYIHHIVVFLGARIINVRR